MVTEGLVAVAAAPAQTAVALATVAQEPQAKVAMAGQAEHLLHQTCGLVEEAAAVAQLALTHLGILLETEATELPHPSAVLPQPTAAAVEEELETMPGAVAIPQEAAGLEVVEQVAVERILTQAQMLLPIPAAEVVVARIPIQQDLRLAGMVGQVS